MKNFFTRFAAWIVLAVMFVMLIPGISLRISSENNNNNIVVSFYYDSFMNKISSQKLEEVYDELKEIGVKTVSIKEEDVNYLSSRGEVTSIKYNVLCHKYDEQSLNIAKHIKENCPGVSLDSHLVLISKDEMKEFFKYSMPRRYSEKEYSYLGEVEGLDVYVLYDGKRQLFDYAVGYNENAIRTLSEKGFEVALIHNVMNYRNVEYLEDIERLVKEYDIDYMNIKKASQLLSEGENDERNYEGISDIVNSNDMTLVVTENTDHLSNQKCFGYSYIFDKALENGGPGKIMRSYETYDNSHVDETNYKFRTEQFFNSTIDRNMRFITVTLINAEDVSYADCTDYSLMATKEYIEKIEQNGFNVTSDVNKTDYTPNRKLNSAACAVIMIMCALIAYQMITGSKNAAIVFGALVLSAFAFAASFFMPDSLLSLYPTVYSVVHSCFAVTVLLYFLKKTKDKLSLPVLTLSGVLLTVGTLLLWAVGQGTMLSGISYYVNNDIFRGIKLSLLVPIVYSTCVYYLMFIKKSDSGFLTDVKNVLNAHIKVYWVIVALAVGAIGVYYIIRSGNVSSISPLEQLMRTTLTNLFPARPRTKEFLIGYPALVLLIYYVKRTNADVIKWILAIATSILAASIANSFCHVFTNFGTIVTRTLNGLIVGVFVSIGAFIANIILLKIVNVIIKRLNNTEIR